MPTMYGAKPAGKRGLDRVVSFLWADLNNLNRPNYEN